MMVRLLILALIGAAIAWALRKPKPLFRLHFVGGKLASCEGKVSRGFVAECEAVLTLRRIRNATILGYADERLEYSKDLPESVRQSLHNVWRQYTNG